MERKIFLLMGSLQLIANTTHRLQDIPCCAQLGTQGTNVDIDRAGLAVIIGAPNGGKQTVAAEHLTRVFQKQPQQIVLLEREGNRRTVYLYHMAAFIHENAALPQNGWSRRYKVKVHGRVSQNKIDSLTGGVTIDGINYGPVKIVSGESQGTNSWLTITLQEGKNREIRRLMKHVGLEVARLIRLSYGPFQLGGLKKGEVREVPQKVLKEQLGEKFKL